MTIFYENVDYDYKDVYIMDGKHRSDLRCVDDVAAWYFFMPHLAEYPEEERCFLNEHAEDTIRDALDAGYEVYYNKGEEIVLRIEDEHREED